METDKLRQGRVSFKKCETGESNVRLGMPWPARILWVVLSLRPSILSISLSPAAMSFEHLPSNVP